MGRLFSYLLFDGTCKEAMECYQSVFGGELVLTHVGDSPMAGAFPETLHKRVIHARLTNGLIEIPASDWLAQTETPIRGNMNCMYISGWDKEETKQLFDSLSKDSTITDPFTEQPFGFYGRLIDTYGVIWMFHAEKK